MLAVTRLENVLCEKGYPVPTNTTTYYRIGAREGVRTRPHTTAQGGNTELNLDSQNLCLTKTCCNCSARLCPLKITFRISKPHLETTKLQGP